MRSDIESKLIRQNFFVVLLMFVIKSASKLVVGIHVGSATLISDGVRNINDILQFIGTCLALRFVRKDDPEKYPVGKFALESVVSIIIGASLVWVGLEFFWSGTIKILSAIGVVDWLTEIVPIATELLGTESPSLSVMPYVVALTILGSAVLSRFVYKYEMGIAKRVKCTTTEDAARELRADMWIEIAAGLGLLLGRVFQFSLADPVLSVAVSALVVHSGYEMVKERTLNLLNRAIESNDRDRVINALKSIEGVSEETPGKTFDLKAYFLCQGMVRVEAMLPIRVVSIEGISQVLNVARSKIKTALSSKYGDVDVFLSHKLLPTVDSRSHLCRSIDNHLKNIWEVSTRHGDDMHALMEDYVKSNLSAVVTKHGSSQGGDELGTVGPSREVVLALYLVAKSHLLLNGPLSEPTRQAYACLRKQTTCESLSESARVAIENALCEFAIESAIRGGASEGLSIAGIRNTLTKSADDGEIDHQLRAEAAHLLARSYYKLPDYNLDHARKWFRSAKEMHLSVPDSLFADHALTDWGNFEAQVFRLDDAETYLNDARLLKERKGDQHGLAITYGCLANVSGRRGDFDKALELLNRDLDIVRQLGIKGEFSHVSCKIADLLVKRGLLNTESASFDQAIALLVEFEQAEPKDFFLYKGCFKAQFGKWWLNPGDNDSLEQARSAERILRQIAEGSPNLYQKAILNRISGRIAAAKHDWQISSNLFEASARCFSGLEGPKDLPIQATLSQIEGLRWSALTQSNGWASQLEARLATLEQECGEVNLDLAKYLLPLALGHLRKMEKRIHRLSAGTTGNQANPGNAGHILRPLDRLIWYLEL